MHGIILNFGIKNTNICTHKKKMLICLIRPDGEGDMSAKDVSLSFNGSP